MKSFCRLVFSSLAVLLPVACSIRASQASEVSSLSPYVMMHELGIYVRPIGAGCLPKGFERPKTAAASTNPFRMTTNAVPVSVFSPEIRGGNQYEISDVLCGRKSTAQGMELHDVIMSLGDLDGNGSKELVVTMSEASSNEKPH